MSEKAANLWEYIKTKTFYKHLALSLITVAALVFGALKFLNAFTDHNESIEVPNFIGVKTTDISSFILGKNVRFQIIDSIYEDTKPRGSVVEQTPGAGFKVKNNRTIYLIVNAMLPAQVKVPNLKDASLRQATAILNSCGLKLGKLTYVPDIARNAVLKQFHKNKSITPGVYIPKGSVIDLVLGQGESDEDVIVPDLIGLTRKEALESINLNSLTVGAEIFEGNIKDSSKVWVYRQRPETRVNTKTKSGTAVDIFYTTDVSKSQKSNEKSNKEEDDD